MNLKAFRSSERCNAPHFLLIGQPVSGSLSPLMHNTAARFYGMDVNYYGLELQAAELSAFASYLNREELKGVNITIPYKQLMMDYVDELDRTCQAIGAMNTIKKEHHKLIGCNTDAYGFLQPLKAGSKDMNRERAIVFGTGGASKAIVYALLQWGIQEVILVSRNPGHQNESRPSGQVKVTTYDAWTSFAGEAGLIVNATPLGMEPHIQGCPVREAEAAYLRGKTCYDIVYKPAETVFLKLAKKAGARTIGGLEMLIQQGSRSFELWTGRPFPLDHIRDTLKNHLNDAC